MTDEPTPASCGFSMPAEWELHEATWLTWPHNPETWIGPSMEEVEAVYVQMISALVPGESVHLIVKDETQQQKAANLLKQNKADLDKVRFFVLPTNDSWVRDYGPNFLTRETDSGGTEIAANLWHFDSWGKKYNYDLDSKVSETLTSRLKVRTFKPGIVLEGGSIEVNGQGTVLTTRQCLLSPNRNETPTIEMMERYLRDFLGVQTVVWLDGEITGDDTDGHIDNIARFTDSKNVVAVYEENTRDPNHACLKKNLEALKSARDQNGNGFNVTLLPTPGRVAYDDSPLPASYANFYIGNQAILLPVFGDPNDAAARDILASLFTDREIVPVDGKVLVSGLGGPHCLTQQQPIEFDF